ncbi:uncharacterized protein CTRU02_210407 [Colletotrichum truncatum]|uniref:Uncharacterized protein n=1 Tax=Colletotrichum truncatum TaxID=5467 RepID=A0ACC3YNW6_COLTU
MSLHHKPPVLTYRYSHHKSLFTHSRFVTHLGKLSSIFTTLFLGTALAAPTNGDVSGIAVRAEAVGGESIEHGDIERRESILRLPRQLGLSVTAVVNNVQFHIIREDVNEWIITIYNREAEGVIATVTDIENNFRSGNINLVEMILAGNSHEEQTVKLTQRIRSGDQVKLTAVHHI